MINPMLDYAKENGITLTGEFYGREETLTGKEIGLWRTEKTKYKNICYNIKMKSMSILKN